MASQELVTKESSNSPIYLTCVPFWFLEILKKNYITISIVNNKVIIIMSIMIIAVLIFIVLEKNPKKKSSEVMLAS